jgi:hypothetical protein
MSYEQLCLLTLYEKDFILKATADAQTWDAYLCTADQRPADLIQVYTRILLF